MKVDAIHFLQLKEFTDLKNRLPFICVVDGLEYILSALNTLLYSLIASGALKDFKPWLGKDAMQ